MDLTTINEALKQYYLQMGSTNYCLNGDGLFLEWCRVNAIEHETKNMDPIDFVDFDEDFPLNPPVKDPTIRSAIISRIIQHCHYHGRPPSNVDWVLWTTKDVFEWIISFKGLASYHKHLKEALSNSGVNGYNITKYTKKRIYKEWGIKNFKHRNLIYTEIQNLTSIPIDVQSWTVDNVAQFIVSIFEPKSSNKSDEFKNNLRQEMLDQEADGMEFINMDKADVECFIDESNYENKTECETDVDTIYDAIQMVQKQNEVTGNINQQSHPPYCSEKEKLVDDCLVVFLGIGYYHPNQLQNKQQIEAKDDVEYDDNDKKINVLDVEEDHKCLEQTFEKEYKYKWIDNNFQTPSTVKDIHDFLYEVRDKHLKTNGQINHNGLIICIAGHGCNGHLFSSDWKKIPLKDIRSKFSDVVHTNYANLPKIFVVNCCRDDDNKQACGGNVNDASYAVTLCAASADKKVFSAKFSKSVAQSFSDHKDKPTKFQIICKTIHQKHPQLKLNELDLDILNDVQFRKKYKIRTKMKTKKDDSYIKEQKKPHHKRHSLTWHQISGIKEKIKEYSKLSDE